MKLALHRSIIFWSGLLVMAFVCWAWWKSEQGWVAVTRPGWELSHSHSMIRLERSDEHFWIPAVRSGTGSEGAVREWLPAPLFRSGEEEPGAGALGFSRLPMPMREQVAIYMAGAPREDWVLLVPHWLIVLAVAVPWLGLLVWRGRRRRHIIIP